MAHLILEVSNSPLNRASYGEERLFGKEVFFVFESVIGSWKSVAFIQLIIALLTWIHIKLMELLSLRFSYVCSLMNLPLGNTYRTIASAELGHVAGIGAMDMRGKELTLAIDLGTCITFDLINRGNFYRRETIIPELWMHDKILHKQIALLSLIEFKGKPNELIGNNTLTCMQISICHEIELELREQSKIYIKKFSEIEVFYNVYPAQSFDSLAKGLIFVVPNLVPYGLNSILNHNVE